MGSVKKCVFFSYGHCEVQGVSTVRYGTVRCGTVRYGTVRCGTVRYGTVRVRTLVLANRRISTVRYGTRTYFGIGK